MHNRGWVVRSAVFAVAAGAALGVLVAEAGRPAPVPGRLTAVRPMAPPVPDVTAGPGGTAAPGETAPPGERAAPGGTATTVSDPVLSAQSTATADTTRFVAVAPRRLLDTRATGAAPDDGGVVRVSLAGDTGLPTGATAVVINLTVTETTAPGFLTAWPAGAPRPLASNVNVTRAGQTVANLAVVPLGAERGIEVYVQRRAHLVVDLLGAFEPAATARGGRLVAERPRRVLDTRTDRLLAAGEVREVDLGPGARDADAAVVNLTATESVGPGFVTAWAAGEPRPATSNVNVDAAGRTVANLAVVPLRDGRLAVSSLVAGHLVVDVAGLFTGSAAVDSADGLFVPLAPTRVADTRQASPRSRLVGGVRADLPVAGQGGVPPSGAAAALVNVTATETSLPGFLTVYPAGTERPLASNVNAERSWQTVPNLVVARLGAGGAISLHAQHTAQVVVDALGWFTGAPEPGDPGVPATAPEVPPAVSGGRLELTGAIGGAISPKSVVATGAGLLFAQNMMYTHTVTVYDRRGDLVATIPDRIDLAAFGLGTGVQAGAPVEAAVAPDGRHVYVSNYNMYGAGAGRQGFDECTPADGVGDSTVYRIDVSTLAIDRVIPVGPVPKFLAVSPDGRWLVVSNWCGDSVSIVDAAAGVEVRRVRVGRYPRGLAVTADSSTVYVALMGDDRLAAVTLDTGAVAYSGRIGSGPRHLNLAPDGRWLYVTLNADGVVAKVDTTTLTVVARVATGTQPRSAALAADGRHLYVVNYESQTASRIRTDDWVVDAVVGTANHPIGIAYDDETRQVYVACYDGRILLFAER